ncbi:hypothetical protein M0R45_006466 [Rubus argutus]|uniref:CCHC-type domain-containing protein n=1 Tax=Rubus argutus TaxID=59490 RepID=A0AAW1YR62_RUBAR
MHYKRGHTDDMLCDKLKAVQATASESDSPSLYTGSSSKSYASMLLNPLSHYGNAATDDFDSTEDDCSYSTGKIGHKVRFSERVYDKINLEWRCAVIIKLVGKPNSTNAFKFMSDSLRRKWKLQGPWQLIDMPNDYFVVKFHLHEDMTTTLCGGPWIIAGQTLVVQQWKPDFNPYSNTITTMAVWVRIVGLPLKFFKDYTMRSIGRNLGTVVKVDKLTLAQSRGQFGRLCVEIDLHKPLLPYVEVEDDVYNVVYEGISMICFNCGCFGHAKDACPHQKSSTVKETDVDAATIPNMAAAKTDSNCSDTMTDDMNIDSSRHGAWMFMSYKNKKRDNMQNGQAKGQAIFGSRFSVLVQDDEDAAKAKEASVMEPVVPSAPSSHDKVPRIVTLWKSLEKKTQVRNDNKNKPPLAQDPTEPKSLSPILPCDDFKKPMRDITNGNSSGSGYNMRTFSGKSRKYGSSSKTSRGSGSATSTLPIPSPDISSLCKEGSTNPPYHNDSAMFGHCPPENDLMAKYCDTYVDSAPFCKAQNYSDIASNVFQQVADMPQDDHSLDSDNDEASMDAAMFSSNDENMTAS